MFCELKMKWEFLNRLKHLICVCTYTCECGGPSTTLGSCLFPHYLWIELRPSGLAARTTLPAEPFCWPQFLFFYFQTWSTMWTWWLAHTTISASWEAEAGGQFWVKGFEAGLGSNIARLSWNKKSRPQISGLSAWNPTVIVLT